MLSEAGFATLFPIRDTGRAIKFYTSTLGGRLMMRGEGEMKDSWAFARIRKSDFWLIQPQKREKRELAYSTFVVKDIRRIVKSRKGKSAKFHRAETTWSRNEGRRPNILQPLGRSSLLQ